MPLLTPPPAAPQRGDRTTFASRVDAFITWLINFVTELVSLVANLNSIAAGGAYAIPYVFDSSIAAGPVAGHMRIGNTTQNTATSIQLSTTRFGGGDVAAIVDSFDDSTSTIKGHLRILKQGDTSKWIEFDVTGWSSQSGYRFIGVTCTASSSANPFADGDAVMLFFDRTGDKGDRGDPGASANLTAQTIYARDEKPQGTHGGALTSGAARTLNTTKINSIPGASLSNNRVTIPAGTYNILGRASAAAGVQGHRVVLWNVTNTIAAEAGSTEYTNPASDGVGACSSRSVVEMRNLVLASAITLELRHYFSGSGVATTAGGYASNQVGPEVYAELIIEKVA